VLRIGGETDQRGERGKSAKGVTTKSKKALRVGGREGDKDEGERERVQ
jgi:hypothetical protein